MYVALGRPLAAWLVTRTLALAWPLHFLPRTFGIMSLTVYSKAASYAHWIVAVPLIGCVGTVLKAQEAPKSEKGLWMHRHKSLGLLTGILVAPRVGYRLFNAAKYRIEHIAGTGPLEQKAADASHFLLYGFMTIMPASGIAMGYFGGKGLPFFGTTFSGIVHTDETKKGNQKIAGQAFKIHKQLGTYGKFLIPLHAAGAVQHAARGHTIFARINPFRSPKH